MKRSTFELAVSLVLCIAGPTFLSACASAPRVTDDSVVEKEMRDADLDVIFATEFPVASKEEALARANSAMSNGDVDRAVFFYVKALKYDVTDTGLVVTIGRIHEYRGNAELAVRAYSMALHTNPDLVEALEGRGLLLLANGESSYAEADLRRAVQLDPAAWRAHNGLGLLEDGRNNHAVAAAQYGFALEAKPGSPMLLNNRGYSRMLAGDHAGALEDLQQAANQDYDRAWVNLGVLYGNLRRYDEAVEALAKVFTHPEALNRTGASALENRDFELARKLFQQAIERSPVWYPEAEENLERVVEQATAALR